MTLPVTSTADHVLVLRCPDTKGIVAAVAGFLADRDASIVEGLSHRQMLDLMDRAGIERALLIATKTGQLGIAGSWHLPYEVVAEAVRRFGPNFAELLPSCRIWLNGEAVSGSTVVTDKDEVAVLPPVSGGCR